MRRRNRVGVSRSQARRSAPRVSGIVGRGFPLPISQCGPDALPRAVIPEIKPAALVPDVFARAGLRPTSSWTCSATSTRLTLNIPTSSSSSKRMPQADERGPVGSARKRRVLLKVSTRPSARAVAYETGFFCDYFLDDALSTELHELGAELWFKPPWLEDFIGLARSLLKVTH
jgi:hypothetical protein